MDKFQKTNTQTRFLVMSRVGSLVFDLVYGHVGDQIWNQVWDQVCGKIEVCTKHSVTQG